MSPDIVDELRRVTAYSRLRRKYARIREHGLEFVELVARQSIWTTPTAQLTVISRDESDNRYIECAVAGAAEYIVSGDSHLLAVRDYRGIHIVTPAAFMALLGPGNSI